MLPVDECPMMPYVQGAASEVRAATALTSLGERWAKHRLRTQAGDQGPHGPHWDDRGHLRLAGTASSTAHDEGRHGRIADPGCMSSNGSRGSRASVRRSRDRSMAGSRGASRDADPQRCARKTGFCSSCQPPCPPLSGGYRRLPTLAFDIGMTAISLLLSLADRL